MGYSGFEEFICNKGHYSTFDANLVESQKKCKCGSKFKWHHSVDTTNGYGEISRWSDPDGDSLSDESRYHDQEAPKKVIGKEDNWHTDKYGNRYSTQEALYEPNNPGWDVWN